MVDTSSSIRTVLKVLTSDAISSLSNDFPIRGHTRRMWHSVEDQPGQSISAANDLTNQKNSSRPWLPSLFDHVSRGDTLSGRPGTGSERSRSGVEGHYTLRRRCLSRVSQ